MGTPVGVRIRTSIGNRPVVVALTLICSGRLAFAGRTMDWVAPPSILSCGAAVSTSWARIRYGESLRIVMGSTPCWDGRVIVEPFNGGTTARYARSIVPLTASM